jgi:mono/diheme cytochrome c family protein
LRGFQVTEVLGKMGTTPVTLYVDSASGILRGYGNVDSIMFANEMAVSKEPVSDKEFVFVPPVGAVKEEPKSVNEVTYASVAPIFKAACLNCHNSGNSKGGYSVEDYSSVLKRVTPGDAKNSIVVQYIKGVRQPRMPRGGSLSSADIESIENWVNAGAKN